MLRIGFIKTRAVGPQNQRAGAGEFFCPAPAKTVAPAARRLDAAGHAISIRPAARIAAGEMRRPMPPGESVIFNPASRRPVRPPGNFKVKSSLRPDPAAASKIKRAIPPGQRAAFKIKGCLRPGQPPAFNLKSGRPAGRERTFNAERLALVKQNQHFRHNSSKSAQNVECGDTSPLWNWETCLPVTKRGHVRALQNGSFAPAMFDSQPQP
jgi:hypothetical protein